MYVCMYVCMYMTMMPKLVDRSFVPWIISMDLVAF